MKILVIDTETSSLDTCRAEILEVGAATVDIATGALQLVLDTLVHPAAPAAEWQNCWFMENSGLHPEDLAGAPRFDEIAGRVQELADAMPVTAFNLAFDRAMLEARDIRMSNRWPCLMLTCTPILKIDNGRGDWKWPSFEEAWQYFFPGSAYKHPHRAADDALHEAALAWRLIQRGYFDKQMQDEAKK